MMPIKMIRKPNQNRGPLVLLQICVSSQAGDNLPLSLQAMIYVAFAIPGMVSPLPTLSSKSYAYLGKEMGCLGEGKL